MQCSPNIDDKKTIEIYDWKDTSWEYNPWAKKYYRKIRRKKLNRLVDKQLKEVLNYEY